MQTFPIRKSSKTKNQYLFPVVMLAITALLISAVSRMAIPDPLGNSIQKHMEENSKSQKR